MKRYHVRTWVFPRKGYLANRALGIRFLRSRVGLPSLVLLAQLSDVYLIVAIAKSETCIAIKNQRHETLVNWKLKLRKKVAY